MHILEDHITLVQEWLSMHQAGSGLIGEQMEVPIHTKFNSSIWKYLGSSVAKMKSILQDHYLIAYHRYDICISTP